MGCLEKNVAVCNGPGEIWVKYPCWQQEWGALNHIESSPIGAQHQENVIGGQTLPGGAPEGTRRMAGAVLTSSTLKGHGLVAEAIRRTRAREGLYKPHVTPLAFCIHPAVSCDCEGSKRRVNMQVV